jgi:hypothetical protein
MNANEFFAGNKSTTKESLIPLVLGKAFVSYLSKYISSLEILLTHTEYHMQTCCIRIPIS